MPDCRIVENPYEPRDGELVRAYLAGDLRAGETLLERHWASAWRAAYAVLGGRADADDATQSAVERAFRALHRFDTARPFGPWLSRIAANQALNHLRSRGREEPLGEEIAAPEPYSDIATRDELMRALARLPQDRRLVVVLRYWADLAPADIAAALEIPVGTVTSRLWRALEQLRATLTEEVGNQ